MVIATSYYPCVEYKVNLLNDHGKTVVGKIFTTVIVLKFFYSDAPW